MDFVTNSNLVLTTLRDAAVGLEALHSQGDVHAGNVMVRASGGAVVIDLGHARKVNQERKYQREGELVEDVP